MKLEIKGFTDDQLKGMQKAFDMLSSELQAAVAEKLKGLAGLEAVAELKKMLQTEDGKDKVKGMQSQLDDLDALVQKVKAEANKKMDKEFASFRDSVKSIVESDEFKEAFKKGELKDKTFEIKADTSVITGTVNLTQQNLSVTFAPDRALAFIPYLNSSTLGANKNRVLWVEGTYTDNAGYVGELTAASTADTIAASEKTRQMAKISAILPISSELMEDADYIANAARMKMQSRALLFVDGEVYDGDGDDSSNPTHIYGILGQSTTYSSTTTGSAASIELANIGDLVDDMLLQAELSEQRGLNTLAIHPKTFAKFRYAKDANGNYLFVREINGTFSISGLTVRKSTRVTAGTLLIYDSSKVQLWWKRNLELKFTQMNNDDITTDQWTAVLFARCQQVIEGPDQTAVMYCDDVETAIAALTEA